jgi:membrane protein YdbS with pleckstrin-like domain
MASTKFKRISSLWRIVVGLLMLISAVDAVRVLQQPDALRFFAFWIEVAVVVGAVGSVVALLIVAFRRIAGSEAAHSNDRIF